MKKFIVGLLIVSLLVLVGCGKVSDVVSSAKEVKDAVESSVDQIEDVIENDQTEVETQEEEKNDEEKSEDLESSNEAGLVNEEELYRFSNYIEDMKAYFTDGHRQAGFIYKPSHDQINDIASYVSTYKKDVHKSDYADEFEWLQENNFFKDQVSDIRMSTNKEGHLYTNIGKGFKSSKQEVETFSFDKSILYDGQASIDYRQVRDYVDGDDFDRIVQYRLDGDKLYISLSQYNNDLNTVHQMLVYYDGVRVQVGHNLDVSGQENVLLYDLKDIPSGLEDFFSDHEFTVFLTYDGNTTSHESKE